MNDKLPVEATLSFHFAFFLIWGQLKGKNLLQQDRSKFFPLSRPLFGMVVLSREAKYEASKVVSLCKNCGKKKHGRLPPQFENILCDSTSSSAY